MVARVDKGVARADKDPVWGGCPCRYVSRVDKALDMKVPRVEKGLGGEVVPPCG